MAPLHVIAVTGEVLRRKLPIAGHDPFVDAADDRDAAFPAIEKRVEIPGHLAEIVAQRRRLGIEGGEYEALVAVELRYRDEAPPLAVEVAVIRLLQVWDPGEPSVVAVGPAVIGAGQARRVAVIGTAQPVATMPADIQESAHLPVAAADDQNRVFAHIGGQEIARLRNLAVVTQIQPAAREDLLQLLFVDLGLDEDTAADQATIAVDKPCQIRMHWSPPPSARPRARHAHHAARINR